VQAEQLNTLRLRTWSEGVRTDSESTNLSAGLKFDNDGKLKFSVRYLYGKAKQSLRKNRIETDLANGRQWGAGTGFYPNPNGGPVGITLPTNPSGYVGLLPLTVDYRGDLPVWGGLSSTLVGNITNYGVGAIVGEENYDRDSQLNTVRFDANYELNDALSFDFGARYSDRDLANTEFDYLAPLYPTRSSNGTGCLVRWVATDINIGGWAGCRSGDPAPGSGTYTALQPQTLSSFGPNVVAVSNLGGVAGIPTVYAVDPALFDSGTYYRDRFGAVQRANPNATYDLGVKQTTFYGQLNGDTDIGMPVKFNLGLRVLKTNLTINQRIDSGIGGTYGGSNLIGGVFTTKRSYTEFLPAFNAVFDVADNIKARLAFSKNSTMLDGKQLGGGFRTFFQINAQTGIAEVVSGSSDGNPQLKPWRSTNYDASLEWYNAPGSVFSLALFNIDVASFPEAQSVTLALPDGDGVVRRSISIPTIGQGKGGSLRGVELNAKQALTYLPGFLSNFGVDANITYSPSSSNNRDITGAKLPFQDNSKIQTNLALWYQNGPLQARVAHNYRSKRFLSTQAKIQGLATYQEATNYIDASISYDVLPNLTMFVQGSNLTGESERYYIQFPDQKNNRNGYEARYTFGIRGKF
jgi:iron complex outermembrane recepter protein